MRLNVTTVIKNESNIIKMVLVGCINKNHSKAR